MRYSRIIIKYSKFIIKCNRVIKSKAVILGIK